MAINPELIRLYDELWADAERAFAASRVHLDPHLEDKDGDVRRGLSVILRPQPVALGEIGSFVDELKKLEPGQYHYQPSEYHVTVLSLLTCSIGYQHSAGQIESYERAVSAAVETTNAFEIQFQGITATAEAVMIQGFPEEDALNRLRNRIIETLEKEGMSARQRYAPKAAHMTVMRFRRRSGNFPALARTLRSFRTRAFGTTRVGAIQLVENDWYLSADKLRLIKEYELSER